MGSKRQSRLADFVFNRLVADKLEARIQSFDAQVPIRKDQDGYGRAGNYKRTVKGYNVLGYLKMDKPSECIQMVGSHYDTKHIPGLRYVGANDSASSSALLFQLASHFKKNLGGLGCDLLFVWFDGEESVLDDWNTAERAPYGQQDNTYGSRYFVSQMKICGKTGAGKEQLCWREQLKKPIKELILIDMVGSQELKISLDRLSSDKMLERLKASAKNLGFDKYLDNTYTFVEDDHTPFRKAGIDAIDIIDFNNLDYWHKPGDEVKNISFRSIEIAGQIAVEMIENSQQ